MEEIPSIQQTMQARPHACEPADVGIGGLSSDVLPLEYPTYGSADLRHPALHVLYPDDSRITKLSYVNHKVVDGKAPLEGLPATYIEPGDAVQTLIITLQDALTGLTVRLQYSVFETLDAICRSAQICNNGDMQVVLRSALNASVDFQGQQLELLHLPGAWARERNPERIPLMQGRMVAESLRGYSSAHHNPFLAVLELEVTERNGRVWAMNLVYSGNFEASTDVDPYGHTRMSIGLQSFDFS